MLFHGMEGENVRLTHKVYIFFLPVERELEIRSDGVWPFYLFGFLTGPALGLGMGR